MGVLKHVLEKLGLVGWEDEGLPNLKDFVQGQGFELRKGWAETEEEEEAEKKREAWRKKVEESMARIKSSGAQLHMIGMKDHE
jgi:CO dehydrogenase/acetyl-CoA synthase beta subunit